MAGGEPRELARRVVVRARKDGSWIFYGEAEDLTEPDDLGDALNAASEARRNWDRFPASARKGILWWIKCAKTDATREKRLRETVEKSAANRKANFPPGRDAGPKVA